MNNCRCRYFEERNLHGFPNIYPVEHRIEFAFNDGTQREQFQPQPNPVVPQECGGSFRIASTAKVSHSNEVLKCEIHQFDPRDRAISAGMEMHKTENS